MRIFSFSALCYSLVVFSLGAQTPTVPTQSLNAKQYQIGAIKVEGPSRFSARSIAALSGLKVGSTVDEAAVRAACERIGQSGLVTHVEYVYEAYPDRPSVDLVFTAHDYKPLLPAQIKIPNIEEDSVWKYLQGVDPLFTRELPITEKALALYTRYIEKFLRTQGREDRVIADLTSDAHNQPIGVVFKPGKVMSAPKPRP